MAKKMVEWTEICPKDKVAAAPDVSWRRGVNEVIAGLSCCSLSLSWGLGVNEVCLGPLLMNWCSRFFISKPEKGSKTGQLDNFKTFWYDFILISTWYHSSNSWNQNHDIIPQWYLKFMKSIMIKYQPGITNLQGMNLQATDLISWIYDSTFLWYHEGIQRMQHVISYGAHHVWFQIILHSLSLWYHFAYLWHHSHCDIAKSWYHILNYDIKVLRYHSRYDITEF